jgi:hypothetical protein
MRFIECEQGTHEWLEMRRGVITGTKLEQAFKQSEALKNQLIAERMVTFIPQSKTSADMDKGNALEPIAKKMYTQRTGIMGEDVGFILHPDRDDIGLSPDWIIDGGSKAVEIKCPKWTTHIEYIRGELPPKKYLFQLLNYFFCIPELEQIDFVSYDELNEVKPLDIKTVFLGDLLNMEYLKNKTVGSMENLEEKVYSFADSVHEEYSRMIF